MYKRSQSESDEYAKKLGELSVWKRTTLPASKKPAGPIQHSRDFGDEDEARETPNPEQRSQEQSSREGQIEETENTTQEWSGGKEKEVMNGSRPMVKIEELKETPPVSPGDPGVPSRPTRIDHRRGAVPDNIAASGIQICRLAYPAGKMDENSNMPIWHIRQGR
ncbi:hypothetical protein B0H17DRAFT_1135261 [Mycena rosella]|uniref:Uncharacterized protein n=1 Tax=Mycena rosella TaxID=1033263 RepID=A0AAD7GD20_MYCRO|nr:hypothetical protein B0H17DRAFT_1135261 [Mycena rosella]